LRDAAVARRGVELALEAGDHAAIDDDARICVAAYNRDDCLATAALRDWLEACRTDLVQDGGDVPRPVLPDDAPTEAVAERERCIQEVANLLLANVPDASTERSEDEHARGLLARMLGYFRREEKCAWWEHFRLSELDTERLREEREAVAGLEFLEELPL